jgi:hypothetical protein
MINFVQLKRRLCQIQSPKSDGFFLCRSSTTASAGFLPREACTTHRHGRALPRPITFLTRCAKQGVDARDKRGHDEVWVDCCSLDGPKRGANPLCIVMAGPCPGHPRASACGSGNGVDARDERGHDCWMDCRCLDDQI